MKIRLLFKNILWTIATPVIRKILGVLLKSKGKKYCGLIYNSLSELKGMDYFCVNENDYHMIVNTKDREIGKGLFCSGRFDYNKLITAINLIKASGRFEGYGFDTIVDVGANIGTISIPAVLDGLFSKAVAVEPHPHNFKLLHANVVLNGLNDKFTLHNAALGENDGVLEMEVSDDNFGDHRILVSGDDGKFNESKREKIDVKCTSIDSILDLESNDDMLIWMDVQGYEGYVLSGARQIISKKMPLVIEFWPYGMNRANSFEILKESLKGYNGFYDLDAPSEFHEIIMLDNYFKKIGIDGNFVDLLVI